MTRRPRRKSDFKIYKFLFVYFAALILVLNILPALLVGGWWMRGEKEHLKETDVYKEQVEPSREVLELDIYHVEKEELVNMELEEYIVGVVAGEVPANFHPQAIKAQAVAARTYALHKARNESQDCKYNEDADLCTDFSCCQEFKILESALSQWEPEKREEKMERIKDAVYSTAGIVLSYREGIINSVYHSTCGGNTEDAGAVWSGSGSHPYLSSVECGYCQHSSHYEQEKAIELSAFARNLSSQHGITLLGEDNTPSLEIKETSDTGRNKLVRLGNETLTGLEIRRILDLPSTDFSWRVEGNHLIFETRGFGHGVGLCQYGADGMAQEGKNFEEILKYYYSGADLVKY